MNKSQLSGYYRWIVELIIDGAFSRCEVGRHNSWGNNLFHDVGGFIIIFPRIKMKLELILVLLVIIVICKPDGGVLSKSIIESLEEISLAKDVGVIGNHYGCFTE